MCTPQTVYYTVTQLYTQSVEVYTNYVTPNYNQYLINNLTNLEVTFKIKGQSILPKYPPPPQKNNSLQKNALKYIRFTRMLVTSWNGILRYFRIYHESMIVTFNQVSHLQNAPVTVSTIQKFLWHYQTQSQDGSKM